MGFRGNNVLHRNHFRKDWQRRVKTWFDQPGAKKRRRTARLTKAATSGTRPLSLLRPAVRCPTVKYNIRVRAGRGFSLAELKEAGIRRKEALSIGIPVDHRRKNRSEEGLKVNVERLQAYKERLVVLPRKTRGKKGAEKKAAPEVPSDRVRFPNAAIPLPPAVLPEQPREITEEEREFNAYATLRKARIDQRQAGKNEARLKKKEEAEAALKK